MAVNKRSRTILSGTTDTMNLVSDRVPGDSYLGYSDGLHTIQAVYNNFQGRFEIQAALAIEPDESDWFTVSPNVFLYSEIPVPEPAINPGGVDPRFRLFADQFTGSEGYTFTGNFAWIRVIMDRTDFGDGETYQTAYGEITKVILSS